MTGLNDFSSTVAFVRDNPELTGKIEAVLLHVRARELTKQSRLHIFYSVGLSFLVGLVLEAVRFIVYPFTDTLRFFLSAAAGAAWWAIADALHDEATISSFISAYLVTYFVVDIKHTVEFFRHLLFDLADVVSMSTLTNVFARMILGSGEKGCELLITGGEGWYMPVPISSHFYKSRQPFKRDSWLNATESKFLNLSQGTSDPEAIARTCSEYWHNDC